MKELVDVYCPLYDMDKNSQVMSSGKDIYKFTNPFLNKNKIEENTNIYNVKPFYIHMWHFVISI